MGVLIGIFIWVELINLSFYLMDISDSYLFYGGFLLLATIIMGPIFYFGDNIVMFLRNIKGVFFDKEKKE